MCAQPSLSHMASVQSIHAFFQGESHRLSSRPCSWGSKSRTVKGSARFPSRSECGWFLETEGQVVCLPPLTQPHCTVMEKRREGR